MGTEGDGVLPFAYAGLQDGGACSIFEVDGTSSCCDGEGCPIPDPDVCDFGNQPFTEDFAISVGHSSFSSVIDHPFPATVPACYAFNAVLDSQTEFENWAFPRVVKALILENRETYLLQKDFPTADVTTEQAGAVSSAYINLAATIGSVESRLVIRDEGPFDHTVLCSTSPPSYRRIIGAGNDDAYDQGDITITRNGKTFTIQRGADEPVVVASQVCTVVINLEAFVGSFARNDRVNDDYGPISGLATSAAANLAGAFRFTKL
jgi:hypothetical protein